MAISVRLDEETEQGLERVAAAQGLSKSELIRRCLTEYLSRQAARPSAWQLGADLFGRVGSGRSDRSENRQQLVRESLHARKSRR
jgi:hypothetical protein